MVLYCARSVAVFALPLLTAACIGAELDGQAEELVGEAEGELIAQNGFLQNSLSMNSLSMNSLSMNSLSMNSLSMNSLSMNSKSAIQNPGETGTLARELLRYVVSCSLRC